MFDRVTKGYIWVMLCMAFSVGLVSVEAKKRDAAIETATKNALAQGLWSGCNELTNPSRVAIQGVIAQMEAHHSESPKEPQYGSPYWDKLRAEAPPINCHDYAESRLRYYTDRKVILPSDPAQHALRP